MKKEWKFAFEKTIPVLAGYLSIGIAFGLLMQNMGYNVFWALLISLILYAGSMQFVLLQFLTGGTSLITVAIMTLLVNSRHRSTVCLSLTPSAAWARNICIWSIP